MAPARHREAVRHRPRTPRKALNARTAQGRCDEHQIYRIDHYLGKETVQNILVLRFANGIFEPIWNRNHIDHVQITVAETVGVGHRGSFYDATGALRDMVPNHLFQLLSLVAMEPPVAFDADAVRNEKAEVLAAIQVADARPRRCAMPCAGSIRAGKVGGNDVEDYRKTEDVAPDSTTETYVALKLDDRQLALGRRAVLPAHRQGARRKRTEVAIQFKQAPFALFRDTPVERAVAELSRDRHPAGRRHRAAVRRQGAGTLDHDRRRRDEVPLQGLLQGRARDRLRDADLRLHDRRRHPVPARRQRRGRLARGAAVPRCVEERPAPTDLQPYKAGSEGPDAADELLARDGRHWRKLELRRWRRPNRQIITSPTPTRCCAAAQRARGAHRRQPRPHRDLPDRRIEPEAAL